MKQGKRITPVLPVEYVLLVTPSYNERRKEKVTLFALRTVTEFTNFRYRLVVEPTLRDRTLTLLIQGLSAPELTLPAMGPAEFRDERTGLRGKYEVVVSKHGKAFTAFTINITPAAVRVENVPDDRFVDIVTRIEDW